MVTLGDCSRAGPQPTLETLPQEVRLPIWKAVGQEEDLSSLLVTSRTIRHDILWWIPGALLSCGCPCRRACRCGKGFEIDRLTLIVDWLCSERRWLKFDVSKTRQAPSSVWCIADLDSLLARPLRYCRPCETIVEFQSPMGKGGGSPAGYLILRAKLFDVCEVLGWFQPQRDRLLQIRFADPLPPDEDGFRKKFWSLRLSLAPTDKLPLEHVDLGFECELRKIYTGREMYPVGDRRMFCESLLMPIVLNSAWRNATIVFDQEPGEMFQDRYFNRSGRSVDTRDRFDDKLLRLTAWAYMDQLIHDDAVSLGDDDLTPYFRQYDDNARAWAAEKPRRVLLQSTFHRSLLAIIDDSYFFDIHLTGASRVAGRLLDPLRSHIHRTRNSSSANSFSRNRPDTEAADWPWNLDPIRQSFVHWALEPPGKRYDECREPAAITFLRWRKAHTPMWPESWARNWPPLKKKRFINDTWYARWVVGIEPVY